MPHFGARASRACLWGVGGRGREMSIELQKPAAVASPASELLPSPPGSHVAGQKNDYAHKLNVRN